MKKKLAVAGLTLAALTAIGFQTGLVSTAAELPFPPPSTFAGQFQETLQIPYSGICKDITLPAGLRLTIGSIMVKVTSPTRPHFWVRSHNGTAFTQLASFPVVQMGPTNNWSATMPVQLQSHPTNYPSQTYRYSVCMTDAPGPATVLASGQSEVFS